MANADVNAFRLAADQMRAARGAFGQAVYAVTLRMEAYASPIADGVALTTPSDATMSPPPEFTPISPADPSWFAAGIVASAKGRLASTVFDVGPITPAYAFLPGLVSHVGTGTGTIVPSASVGATGVTAGTFAVVVKISTAGGVGVAQYEVSTDSGATYGSAATLLASNTITAQGIALAASGSFDLGDTYAFSVTCGGYTPQQLAAASADTSHRSVWLVTGPDLLTAGELFYPRRVWLRDPQSYMVTIQHAGDNS